MRGLTGLLVRLFVPRWQQTEDIAVRSSYGTLAAIVGIGCNLLLFVVKLIGGLALHSVSVTADAINNLSDAGSSIVSLIGVRIAGKPADAQHPFGHGRVEYITALVVAFLVIEVGINLLKESAAKIMRPQALAYSPVILVCLLAAIGVKLWLGLFYRGLGRRIHSQVLSAVFADSMGDVMASSAIVLSLLVHRFTGWNIDGYVGAVVAVLVMKSGVDIARDTLRPLIGEAIDPEVYARIKEFVEGYEGIEGTHDLIVHNYGPGRSMATIHAEVPNDSNVERSHEIIDRIERDAARKLGLLLVIHMDPVDVNDPVVVMLRSKVEELLGRIDPVCSIHDFRVVRGERRSNLVFDMVLPLTYTKEQKEEIMRRLKQDVRAWDGRYRCVIEEDFSYVAE